MYQLSRALVTKILNFILIIAIIIAMLGMAYDFRKTLLNSGPDLRNRVVGARLLLQDADPYYYKWYPGDPETLRDPHVTPNLPVSRVTVPPTGLVLYLPFANLPYFQQLWIYFLLQWFALIASLKLLVKNTNSPLKTRFLLVVGLLFMANGSYWREHVNAGQTYIFYVGLITLSYWILQQKIRLNNEIAGLLLGLTASMRFPVIVFVLPMIILKNFRLLTATVSSFLIFLAISVILFGQNVWLSYFSAMKTLSQLTTGEVKLFGNGEIDLPQVVEGIVFNKLRGVNAPTSNSSIPLLLERFGLHLPTSFWMIGLAIILLTYSLLILRAYQHPNHHLKLPIPDAILIFGSLMVILFELMIPAPRYSYNSIQLLVPLILILKNVNFENVKVLYSVCLLFTGFLISGGLFSWLPEEDLFGQFLAISTLIPMSLLTVEQ